MTQFTCKGVKQINNRISFKHLYHSYLSAFFISAGVPNGEFPEILIAKCRSRFYCTWFFSWTEDFESWREGRKGPSKSGEKCPCRKIHVYVYDYPVSDPRWAESRQGRYIIYDCLVSDPRWTESRQGRYIISYLLNLPLFAGVSRVRALSPAWTGSHAW